MYTPTELSAILLKHLKEIAEKELQTTVTEAVITVPAYFENKQREATMEAGKLAGIDVKALINEPTAAALAYGIDTTKEQKLIVYDLGGGTFDVTVVEVSAEEIKVLATGGDHTLGGKDWDDRIVSYIADQFEADHGIDPLDHLETMNHLLIKGEEAKKTLTNRTKTDIPIICENVRDTYTLTRETFNELTSDLMERTWSLTEHTLEEAGITWRHVSDVLLVGGSTRMPMVHDFIEETIGKPPLKGVHPDEAVAIGAAIKANLASSEQQPSFTLGSSKKIVDVMSHSLGMVSRNKMETRYINSIILRKNEPIPILRRKAYQLETVPRGKNELEVYVTQGESQLPYECSIIGKYTVTDIEHRENSLAQINIGYAYDENGVIQVSATDKLDGTKLTVNREAITSDLSWLREAPKQEIESKPDISVAIALDLSGSMAGEPIQEAQNAAQSFINKMDLSHASISLIGFADDAKTITNLTNELNELNEGIAKISSIFNDYELGVTTRGEPFTNAYDQLEERDGLKYVIVLTDGMWHNAETALHRAETLHTNGIEVIAIGFGDASESFLEQIATTSENALFTDVTNLVSSFSKIAQEMSHPGNITMKKKTGLLGIFK